MSKFKVGEHVQLSSGGSSMTIKSYADDGKHLATSWFILSELKEGEFHEDQLQKIEIMEKPASRMGDRLADKR